MFLIILGLSIALLSFFFALYNMYHALNNASVNNFRRHIAAMAGMAVGGAIFVGGVILWLVKLFS